MLSQKKVLYFSIVYSVQRRILILLQDRPRTVQKTPNNPLQTGRNIDCLTSAASHSNETQYNRLNPRTYTMLCHILQYQEQENNR